MLSWAERYQQCPCVGGTEPSAWLAGHLPWLPRGRALDVAMGEGRNAAFLVEHGYQVVGVEREPAAISRALQRCPEIQALQVDLEQGWRPEPDGFDLVVVINYLQVDLFSSLKACLRAGGGLVYEARTGPGRFRLAPNQLLKAFDDLHVLAYRELDGRAGLVALR